MVFKRVDFKIVLISVISTVSGSLFIWSLSQAYMRATSFGLLILWMLFTAYLIYWLHKLRRDMEQFLTAMKANDASHAFPARRADSFMRNLYMRYNELTSNFRLVRIEREQEHQFFMNTIEHIGTGLLAFDEYGRIRVSNRALHDMFGTGRLGENSRLREVSPELPDLLVNIQPGEQYLLKILVSNKSKQISILTSRFKMDRELITLASFRDISRDIDKTEMEAWQKLTRVVIHEITGSVVPFRLLSSKMLNYLSPEGERPQQVTLEGDTLEDAVSVLEIIHKRSKGLARFADSYKALEQVAKPERKEVSISKLFDELKLYFSDILAERSIKIDINVDPGDLLVLADEQLIFQVLLNLFRNAIEALSEARNPCLILNGYKEENHIILEVNDNGTGIPEEIMKSIFIPFFTTKDEGSGIGLNLSKQIMNAHNSSIIPLSEPGKGTTFRLIF